MTPGEAARRRKGRVASGAAWGAISTGAAILLAAVAIIPFAPLMPEAGLDPGWVFGMNAALERGLVFGRDIIFTFGPYAGIYTRTYGPGSDALVLGGSAVVALALGLGVAGLAQAWWRLPGLLLLAFVIQLAARDAVLMTVPAVFMALHARAMGGRDPAPDPAEARLTNAALALLVLAMAILSLVKGSLLVASVFVLGCAAVLSGLNGRWRAAAGWVVLYLLALPLAWALAGQPVAGLPRFLASSIEIIRGYSNAMAVVGAVQLPVAFVALAFLVLIGNARNLLSEGTAGLVMLGGASGLLFLAFKAGYVRNDAPHVIIAAGMLPVVAWILLLFRGGTLPALALAVALIGHWMLGVVVTSRPTASMLLDVPARMAEAAGGAIRRILEPDALRVAYEARLAALRGATEMPPLTGTADIYSHGQSGLLARQMDWSPRPILQSYSAYTPLLARLNRDHLLGTRAPRNVLMAIEPIDRRLAALEDGLSWPVLLSHYRIRSLQGELAWLERREETAAPPQPGASVLSGRFRLGEPIALPTDQGPLWARIRLQPSLAGQVAGLAFRGPLLAITFEMADGRQVVRRFVPGPASEGFLVSPLVGTTEDFVALAMNDDPSLPARLPARFSMDGHAAARRFWSAPFEVEIARIAFPAQDGLRAMVFAPLLPREAAPGAPDPRWRCTLFSIDSERLSQTEPLRLGPTLHVSGFAVLEEGPRVATQEVNLLLQAPDGSAFRAPLRRAPRPYLERALGDAGLAMTGFTGSIDLGDLRGAFRVLLELRRDGRASVCDPDIAPVIAGGR